MYNNFSFLKRTCGSFVDPIPLTILYCSLVRSHLNNNCTNNTSKQNSTLESVQNNFYVLFHLNLIFTDFPTDLIIGDIELSPCYFYVFELSPAYYLNFFELSPYR
jgi:hypothetical protein